ncbi:MAG TPA: hypothetical protein DIW34_05130, partial [Oribacterium sp.]|nr:hypothetical protein [Oribacterium sp.]
MQTRVKNSTTTIVMMRVRRAFFFFARMRRSKSASISPSALLFSCRMPGCVSSFDSGTVRRGVLDAAVRRADVDGAPEAVDAVRR